MSYTKLSEEDNRRAVELCGLKYKRPPHREGGFFICPKHKDKTPSLRISFEKGVFNCFSCHWSGTINDLCLYAFNRPILSVLGYQNEFDLSPKTPPKIYKESFKEEEVDESKVHLDIRGVIVPVEKSKRGMEYLNSRGIPLEVAREFDVGYAEYIYINKYKFIDRLMIPIYGESGKLVNYEGRDCSRTMSAKVIYPPHSIKPIFNIAKLDRTKPVYVVEGLIDYFLLQTDPFFKNSTSVFGSYLSPYQEKLISTLTELISIPNNDDAGKESLKLLRESLSKYNIPVNELKIGNNLIKDVGEVHEKLHLTVKEFRLMGGFMYKDHNTFKL